MDGPHSGNRLTARRIQGSQGEGVDDCGRGGRSRCMTPRPARCTPGLPVVETSLPLFVNAQFDPLTSRRDLADTDWNRALVPLVADIWGTRGRRPLPAQPRSCVARDACPGRSSDEGPVSALVARLEPSDPQEREDFRGRRPLPSTCPIRAGFPSPSWRSSCEPLEGVVTPEETATLLGLQATLPLDARDSAGKWRAVLDDWRAGRCQPSEAVGCGASARSDPGRDPVRATDYRACSRGDKARIDRTGSPPYRASSHQADGVSSHPPKTPLKQWRRTCRL